LDVEQTPASLPKGETRLDHYAKHVVQVLAKVPAQLKAQIVYVVADAYYSNLSSELYLRQGRKFSKSRFSRLLEFGENRQICLDCPV
jgi:hypothetical protein